MSPRVNFNRRGRETSNSGTSSSSDSRSMTSRILRIIPSISGGQNASGEATRAADKSVNPEAMAVLVRLLRTHDAAENSLDITNDSLPRLTSLHFHGHPPLVRDTIRALAPLMYLLTSVTTLTIANEKLDFRDSLVELGSHLRSLTGLRVLTISNSRLGADGMSALAKGIGQVSCLAELRVPGNSLFSAGAKSTAEMLPKLKKLVLLDISNNQIRSRGAKYLAAGFNKHENLQHVELTGNPLGDNGIASLAKSNLLGLSKLQKLKLANVGMSDKGLVSLLPQLPHSGRLRALSLARNNLGSEGVPVLSENLKFFQFLEDLRLSEVGLNAASVSTYTFSQNLGCVKMLSRLDLDGNGINTDLMKKLASHGIRNLTLLRQLDVSHNPFGDGGMEELLAGIIASSKSNMSKLICRDCDLGDQSFNGLSRFVTKLFRLNEVDVGRNTRVTDAGAELLANCLPHSNLSVLDVTGCSISARGSAALEEARSARTSLDIRVTPMLEALRECLSLFSVEADPQRASLYAPNSLAHATSLNLHPLEDTCDGEASLGHGVKCLAPHLRHLRSLSELYFSCCHMGLLGLNALLPSLQSLSELSAIKFEKESFGTACVPSLLTLCALPRLARMSLRFNKLTLSDVNQLLSSQLSSSLTMIDLQNNPLENEINSASHDQMLNRASSIYPQLHVIL